tara:strand:+ start:6133 stop:7236 length:1104 start_codon:yes stop_codon:yes gene_type:complete
MSFHNNQGMENITPIAESLSRDGESDVTLLDLRSLYAQSSSELKVSKNISIFKEKSIFKNTRKLNKLSKLVFLFTKAFTIRNYGDKYDIYIFSPGGFYEGLIAKKFSNKNKNTYFIEAGVKIYLYLDSQKDLEPKSNFLKNISGYFTTGESPKNKLKNFVNQKNIIHNFGVPRYSEIISKHKSSKPRKTQNIRNLLYLTSAASYHNIDWEDSWQAKTISEIVNSVITEKYIFNIKVHPRDDFDKYKQYEGVKNVNVLYETDIEVDIKNNDCIISGPSSSIHEVSFLGKIYTILWPFDNYQNDYLNGESLVKNIEDLNCRISNLDNDFTFQNNLFLNQLSEAQKFINIDSDSSTKNIIQHIINENRER